MIKYKYFEKIDWQFLYFQKINNDILQIIIFDYE